MGARFVQGMAEGAVHPAFYAMAARWLPEGERASLVSLAMLGGWRGQRTQVASSLDYRVTILDGYNLLLTRIWNVPSTCLGSR